MSDWNVNDSRVAAKAAAEARPSTQEQKENLADLILKQHDQNQELRKELARLQSEVERLRGRCAMQADGIDAAIDYIGSFCAGFPRVTELLDALDKVRVAGTEEYRLRLQAEGVIDAHNAMSDSFVLEANGAIQERAIIRCQDFLSDYAQRLRQQADEAESAGGEHG